MGGSSTCRRDQAAESGTASAALMISDGSSRMGLQVSTHTITFFNVSATLFGVEEFGASLLFVDEAAARLRPVCDMPTHAGHAAGKRDTTAAAALSAEACPERVDQT